MEKTNDSNVLPFPGKPAIFNAELRSRLESGIAPFTDKQAAAVTTMEQIICTFIVARARSFCTDLAQRWGVKAAKKIANG